MTRISKIYRILISALLALLGFSCGNDDDTFRAEYGVPSATYKAKGVVVSEADDSPIKGIKTVFKNSRYDPPNAVYTNSEGSFSLECMEFPRQKLYVQLIDVDAVQFKQLFDFIRDTRKEGRIRADYGCEGFLGNYETEVRDNFFFCRAGVTVGSVLADGSISACPNLRSNFIQGNIYKDDFMDVWNNRYRAFRDRSWAKQGECAACNYFKYCKGNGMHLHDENGNLLFCHLKRLKEAES